MGGRDGGHAPEVDGALPEEAGGAGGGAAEQVVAGVPREAGAGELGGGAAEGDDHGGAQGRGDVHGAGVVGEEGTAEPKPGHQLAQGGAACELHNLGTAGVASGGERVGDSSGRGQVGFASKHQPAARDGLVDEGRRFDEPLFGPALRRPVLRPGVETEDWQLGWGELELFAKRLELGFGLGL